MKNEEFKWGWKIKNSGEEEEFKWGEKIKDVVPVQLAQKSNFGKNA